jgi:hypothetical protein
MAHLRTIMMMTVAGRKYWLPFISMPKGYGHQGEYPRRDHHVAGPP